MLQYLLDPFIVLLLTLVTVYIVDIPYYYLSFYYYFTRNEQTKKVKTLLGKEYVIDLKIQPQDLDIFLHMNNARYNRYCDIGRFNFFLDSGIFREVRNNKGGTIVSQSITVRFRKEMKLFTPFKLRTKLVGWDDKCFYFETSFEGKNGFVHAIALQKQRVVKCSPQDVLNQLSEDKFLPTLPDDVLAWEQSNVISSEKLNPQKKEN